MGEACSKRVMCTELGEEVGRTGLLGWCRRRWW